MLHDCFAAFLYLSYWSFVLHERAIECTVPTMAQASALFGFIVYRTMREIYRLNRPVSALVAAAILANPFWIYILQSYFLSQVISTAWLLAFFLRCCKEHETGRHWGLATTIVFTIYFIMGILLCPIKYLVDVAVVGAFAAILLIWDYRQELFRLCIYGDFLRSRRVARGRADGSIVAFGCNRAGTICVAGFAFHRRDQHQSGLAA
jgi:hypothetical protein